MALPNDPLRTPSLEHKTLLWLVVAFSVAFAGMMWPLAGAVLWALFLAIVFWPMHGRSRKLIRRPSLAALATLLSIVLIVIVPLALISGSVVNEATAFYQKVRSGQVVPGEWLQRGMDALPSLALSLLERVGLGDPQALGKRIGALLASSSQTITNSLLGFGQLTLDFVVSFFIMLYVLFFLLRDGGELTAQVTRAIPLRREQTRELLTQFVAVVRATVKGNVVVAIVQGALGGLAFWFLDVPGATLWGALMALLSLLPAVGAALVWGPVALWKLFSGDVGQGIGLVVWGVLVIGLVDNVLRPVLVGRQTRLPDWLVLVATVGGIGLFGLNGFVIGPVIASMFLVGWNLLTEVRERNPDSDPREPRQQVEDFERTPNGEARRSRRGGRRSGSGPGPRPPGPPRT